MLKRLFNRSGQAQAPIGSLPDGRRIYAIGDIHGRFDLLERLLEAIDVDDERRAAAETSIIFLGDLIDRGPQSAQVVQRALDLSRLRDDCRFLLGNHEEVFLRAMGGDLKALAFFNRIGGRETILSYGISEPEYLNAEYTELLAMLRDAVPAEHLAFLENFEDLIIEGDYAFVHAGIRPGLPLTQQRTSDLRWIREEFLGHTGEFEKIVVHGHTITEAVSETRYRIGLDTGAYATGRLTAMGFEQDRRWVFDTTD